MKLCDLLWLVPLLPLIGAAINGLISNRRGLSISVTHTLALLGSGLAWLWGWGAIVQWAMDKGIHEPAIARAFGWISGG